MWIEMTSIGLDLVHPLVSSVPDGIIHLDSSLLAQSWHGLWDAIALPAQLLAEQFDTDVFAGFRRAFNNFIESGQIWALLVGIVIGYIIRGLTTYG